MAVIYNQMHQQVGLTAFDPLVSGNTAGSFPAD
jgi:hypothetical protein